MQIVLVHSPLVGPSSMVPLADELDRRGWHTVVPDPRRALWHETDIAGAFVDLAVSSSLGAQVGPPHGPPHVPPDVVVAHSGAGATLPAIADRVGPRHAVFLDAIVPGEGPSFQASPSFVEFVDSLAVDGMLPPWHEWWGAERMHAMVPDAALRATLAADTPRVPRRFYDESVPLPAGWAQRAGCCFLQLGPAYDAERERAIRLGWPTIRLDGLHLDAAVRPTAVADALVELISR